MARSGLDALDYCSVLFDEIALEGLDGITLPTLWIRLSMQPQFLLKIDEDSKRFIWKVIKSCPDLEFHCLPDDRPDFIPFNRFENLDQDYGMVVEPPARDLPVDPYPYSSVDDHSVSPGVRGSCATYKSRRPVTEQVAHLSMDQACERFGERRLVAVASQAMRNAALVPIHAMDVEAELNLIQFVLLERIGRSRFHGEVTVGARGLGVLKEPPKNLYYLRKKLLEYRLITKQGFCMRGSNGKNCQGRLYHLPRFFREFRPKYQLMIEQTADILRKAPNFTMLISEFSKQFEGSFNCLKKVAKMSEFQRFIKWEMEMKMFQTTSKEVVDLLAHGQGVELCVKEVTADSEAVFGYDRRDGFIRARLTHRQMTGKVPHRTIYPDAERSEWIVKNTGLERSCRVYRLLDPEVNIRSALEEADEEADPEADSLLKFPDQSSLSLFHSLERQAFNLLHVHGARGIDSNTLRKELGQTPLDARALLKSLANITSAVETFREDVGRTRITKYVASRYVHMSENKLEFSQEEQRLKSLAVKTDAAATAEKDGQLPSLMPAEPVFVMPCAPEEDSGPPVLSRAVDVTPPKPAAEAERGTGSATAAAPAAPTGVDVSDVSSLANATTSSTDNLTDMEHCILELIDPVSGKPISPRKELISLESTDLFSKSSSSRLVKRTRIILEIVQKLKIIDNAFSLRRMVQNSEDDQGILTKMDRKSFNRILKRLADAGLIKNYRLTLSREDQVRQRHLIADESVDAADNTLLKSAIEQAKAAFLVQMGVNSAMQTDAAPSGEGESGTGGLEPDVASSVREYHRRFHNAMGNDPTAGKPHASATKRNQNETYFVPKFRRLQLLQELLFYISRESRADPARDQTEPRAKLLEADPELDLETLPPVYTPAGEIGWQMFISPLPSHASWGKGWSLLCDVLIRMPLCMFLRLVNITYFTPTVHRYMKHAVLRNLPPTHLPEDVVSCLFWKRKYMFSIHEDITRLVFMGLAQFGQQMLAKDQVFVFCNRNASLLDTSISKEGYHKVEADVEYPVKMYHFDALVSLKDYWFDLKTIALSTPLGSRNLVAGQKVTVEIPFYKPALLQWSSPRGPDEADSRDQGQIPGDQLGAGGIDSSMFAHVLRNWKWRRTEKVTVRPSKQERPEGPPRPKRRRTNSERRPAATRRDVSPAPDPDAARLGPVVDVQIHKPSDGSDMERPILVTRGRNLRRYGGAGTKRAASAREAGPSRKKPATATGEDGESAAAAGSAGGKTGGAGARAKTSRAERAVGLASGTERRLRVHRTNTRTKIERFVRSKKRGPKPPRDDTDKRALALLKKQRCDWSERENTYLLLARVALGLLSDTHKVPSRQYLTVRNALHETIEESRNKTALAVQRRIAFMLKRSQTAANVSLTIQEHLLDPEIRRVLGTVPLTQNTHNTSVVFPKMFREVMSVLMSKWDRSASHGQQLPEDYYQLSEEFDIVLGDQVRLGLQVPVPEIRQASDVHLFTAIGLVVSHLSSREDKSSPVAQLHAASQRYPEELMFSALSYLRSTGLASQRRGLTGQKALKEAKFALQSGQPTSKPYILSSKFRHRFIQRYQYGIYADCFAFFKALLWNSLKERCATSVGAVQRGGQAAVIFGLMANNQLLYDVAVPENLIRLSRKEQEQGKALVESLLESSAARRLQESAAEDMGGGAMTLGRSSGGHKRVGMRSMSRLVLLARRESQDPEVDVPPAGANPRGAIRRDTHNYHEQLHIVPFSVLARLDSDGADGGAGGDGPFQVDEQHLPLSPVVAQAARDRLARILSDSAPDLDATLQQLRDTGQVTDDDVTRIRQLCSMLDDAGVLGIEPEHLLAESGLDRERLRRLAAVMERAGLLLRGGVTRLLYVSRTAGEPWVLHSYHMTRNQQELASSRIANGDPLANIQKSLQSVYFLPAPWRRISGTVNRRVLDRLAGAVLSHCMAAPGCTLASVQGHFHPMLTAHQTRLLVELLKEISCLELTETRQMSETTLFSKRSELIWFEGTADDFSPADSVVISPLADAVLKYACFVGDKPYGAEFLDKVGV